MMQIQTLVESLETSGVLFLTSLAVWATVVLATAWSVAACLRRGSPAVRYCVWQFALLGLLVVPILFALLPGMPLGFSFPTTPRAVESASTDSPVAMHPVTNQLASWPPIDFDEQSAVDIASDQRIDSLQPRPTTSSPTFANPATRPASPPANVTATVSAAAATSSRLPWAALLFGLWSAGAAVQGLWLMYSAVRGWKLVRRAAPLKETRFQRALDDLQQRLSLRPRVRLLKTDQTFLPIVIGAFCPRILLPGDCGKWTSERIWMVLSHELAHIQRRDVLWQLLARTAAAVYWFHPLVWLAVRRMRHERERACDDRVLLAGVEATDYAAGLVDVAAGLRGRRLPMAVGIAMAERSQLEDRVRSILDASLKRGPASARVRRSLLLGTTCIVLALGLVRPFSPIVGSAAEDALHPKPTEVKPTESKPSAAKSAKSKSAATKAKDSTAVSTPPADKPDFDDEGNQTTKGSLRVRVVDSKGHPMSGAAIHVGIWTKETFKAKRDYVCDAQGRAEVELPKTLRILRVWAHADGYVPLFAQLWKGNEAVGQSLPEQFTFRLQKGTGMGGVVKDEDGKPIIGAKVEVMHVAGRDDNPNDIASISTWLADDDTARTTDAEGRWTLDNVPPGDDVQVQVKLTHADFVSDISWGDLQNKQRITSKALRAQTATIVMQRGTVITGTVTDPGGKPVEGAVVIWGDRPYWEHRPQQEVRTDPKGNYHFPPLPPGKMTVTVVAEGWMPQLRKIEIDPKIAPVDFQLGPGKKLRIRFVDSSGALVPTAGVRIESWRGGQSLYNDKHPNVLDASTNGPGRPTIR